MKNAAEGEADNVGDLVDPNCGSRGSAHNAHDEASCLILVSVFAELAWIRLTQRRDDSDDVHKPSPEIDAVSVPVNVIRSALEKIRDFPGTLANDPVVEDQDGGTNR